MTSKKINTSVLLGAMFQKSKHIKRFCEDFHIFTQISTDFAWIFTKSKILGLRLQPLHSRFLHRCQVYS